MNYEIVCASGKFLSEVKEKLELDVNRHISRGYKPQGGVSIAAEMHGYTAWYTLCQAMIKA